MVERLVYLGAATQVMLRLATGESLQAAVSNEDASVWSQGTPVHATSRRTHCASSPGTPRPR